MERAIEFVTVVGTFSAFFAFFDLVIGDRGRDRAAVFIFGFHEMSAKDFERSIILSALRRFLRDDRLRKRRILLFSLPLSFLGVFPRWPSACNTVRREAFSHCRSCRKRWGPIGPVWHDTPTIAPDTAPH